MKLLNTLTLITWVAVLLIACGGAGGDPLHGTAWELRSIGRYAPVPGSTITVRFENGLVSGLGGCNLYGGEYQVTENRISIDGLYATEMACLDPAGVMDQEALFLGSLGEAQRFGLAAGQLQIYTSGGEALTFTRVE